MTDKTELAELLLSIEARLVLAAGHLREASSRISDFLKQQNEPTFVAANQLPWPKPESGRTSAAAKPAAPIDHAPESVRPSKPSKPAKERAKLPAIEVGQKWWTRGKRIVSIIERSDEPIGKHPHSFIGTNEVRYTPTGFSFPGRFSPDDLVQLVDIECEPVPTMRPAPTPEPKPEEVPPVELQQETPESTAPAGRFTVMLESFPEKSGYILGRAIAQYGNMTEPQAKALLEGGRFPAEINSFVNQIHADACLKGLLRVKGVHASITEQ
jgi:hypothetical protein